MYLLEFQISEIINSKEVIEWLIIGARFLEERGRATDEHHRPIVHQHIAQPSIVVLIVDLCEDLVKVFHEQQQTFVVLTPPIFDGCQRCFLELFALRVLRFQLLCPLA